MREPRTIWYEAEEEAPALAEDAFALPFRLVPGTFEDEEEPRVALHASWRVSGHHGRMYGGRISGAIQIVAVSLTSGTARARSAEPDHVIPLVPNPLEPGRRGPTAASGNFSVDLVRHLGLPEEPDVYAVFLWLDELVSPAQLCEIRGPFPPIGDRFLDFTNTGVEDPRSGDVELRTSGKRVEGVAWLPRRAPGASPEAVTVLALFDQPHVSTWRGEVLPASFAHEEELRFACDLAPLLPRGRKPKKAFVLAVVGGVLSNVTSAEV